MHLPLPPVEALNLERQLDDVSVDVCPNRLEALPEVAQAIFVQQGYDLSVNKVLDGRFVPSGIFSGLDGRFNGYMDGK